MGKKKTKIKIHKWCSVKKETLHITNPEYNYCPYCGDKL